MLMYFYLEMHDTYFSQLTLKITYTLRASTNKMEDFTFLYFKKHT